MGEKPKVDRYVCKIATMEEVSEKWDTLVREHPDDPNWAVWKKDIIAEISAGGEIPYYGILDGEIICEAYAVPNYTPGVDDAGLREEGTVYLSAFRTVREYRGKGYFFAVASVHAGRSAAERVCKSGARR